MKRIELEKYLGKYVKIELFDGDVIDGKLKKELLGKSIYYTVTKYSLYHFKCSHVKKVEVR